MSNHLGDESDIDSERELSIKRGKRIPVSIDGQTFDMRVDNRQQYYAFHYDSQIEEHLPDTKSIKDKLTHAAEDGGIDIARDESGEVLGTIKYNSHIIQ